ncbi:MAG: formate transporter FocA [Ferrimonas sp.]
MAISTKSTQTEFSPAEMMAQAEYFALSKTTKPLGMTIGLAIMAGLFIALGFVFYVTVTTGSTAGWGSTKFMGGMAFSLGLILTILCGGELFTSTVLSLISRARQEISSSVMFKTWAIVYAGNFVGAMFLVMLMYFAQMHLSADGQWGLNVLKVAQHKLHHSPLQAFSLGILCNILVCLAVWLTFCSKNNLTKALLVILPVAMFVSAGFEHCVANMFMVPLGILIASGADAAFWSQIGMEASAFTDLNWGQFIVANLIPVTLGNIVGGAVFIGLGYFTIFRSFAHKPQESVAQAQKAK